MDRLENIKTNTFEDVIGIMENDDLKCFALDIIKIIPDYFYHVGASSSGKYHPQYALGEGGLYRHTLALVRILNYFFEIECMKNNYTSRERDLLRIAGMMHDSFKSGTQADYESNHHTKFAHPLIVADKIEQFYTENKQKYPTIKSEEIDLIAKAVRSHMGQWNYDERSNTTLPKPHTKYETLLHMCDYLASRKDIEIHF